MRNINKKELTIEFLLCRMKRRHIGITVVGGVARVVRVVRVVPLSLSGA